MSDQSSQQPLFVSFGETLWDLLPSGKVAGGAPMNVAMNLHKLGESVAFISAVGADEAGDELLAYIHAQQLNTSGIQRISEYPTGRVNVDVSDPTEVKYDIEQPAAWDYIQLTDENREKVSQAKLMVYGSLAARNEQSRNTLLDLIDLAALRVFDVNLREPHYTRDRLESLLEKANWAKLNHHELELISDWHDAGSGEQQRIKMLQKIYDLDTICVTRGADGAIMLHEGSFVEQEGFKVEVKDTIGSGDSFLAAWLSRMLKQDDPQQCLRFACAVGAFVASHKGANPPLDRERIEAMI